MNEYMFGVSTKPITAAEAARRDAIAKKFGGTFVGPLTDAGNGLREQIVELTACEGKCWYAIPNRGSPFNRETENKILAAVGPDMEKFSIKRDGLPPIAFTGEEIASASNEINSNGRANRWTSVKIYRTKRGKFIATLSRFTCWQGESDRHAAVSFETAAEIIDWLKEGEPELGSVSQEAVEKAAKAAPEFAAAWVEEVE